MKTLHPVRPNRFVEERYRARLERAIEQMNRSTAYWLRATYRANEPHIVGLMAADELPASALVVRVRRLSRYWQRRFDEMAPRLARYFATTVAQRSEAALRTTLKRGGIAVKFQPSRAGQDVLRATIEENVGLIKSIPQQHFGRIEGMVLRSVQTGRDLSTLTDELEQAFGITRRRAILIAKTQNNQATAILQRVRQVEIGIKECVWVHSYGGKEPRRSHIKAGREKQRFDPAVGWWDNEENAFILPGQLINCRCVSRSILPGFS